MSKSHALSNFIWSIADLLRGPYRPPQYERVMLPLVVLRRFDCVLGGSKNAVLEKYEQLVEQNNIVLEVNNHLDNLNKLKSITAKTISLLQERRTALISAAVTGKLSEEVLNTGINTQTNEPVPNQVGEHHPCLI